MKKEKYVYNERTLQFEKLKLTPQERFTQVSKTLFSMLALAATISWAMYTYLPTPKEKALEMEKKQMNYHIANINAELSNMATHITDLYKKDGEVNRVVFGLDPIDENVWNGGVGGHEKYKMLNNYGSTGEMLSESLTKVDQLKRQLELQKNSLDTVYNLAIKKEKRLASIPSIKPVRSDQLKRHIHSLSGFGIRLHPVHKVKKLHKGIDFTAPKGTSIQATGDGKVVKVEKKSNGSGNSVTIDHGYGYKTLYAHMYTITVKTGERVKKGQEIGKVGSTGTSTAPHCHYEVIVNGKSVNPIDYCLDGLTPQEYKELVDKASQENQSFD
jgi:murein DD-endopeptidase MepM/ murein hydrolase activator NlpD